MEITAKSKLLDVLNAFPDLEDQIVHIAPPFKNLKNPVLRRTVGSLATLERVAQIGGMDADKLVNTLRRHAGQAELPAPEAQERKPVSRSADDPDWIAGDPAFVINGTELLARGEVPLSAANEALEKMSAGQTLLLLTNFEPVLILEAMRGQNRRVFSKPDAHQPGEFVTFIGK
jgi:hypothetical protein